MLNSRTLQGIHLESHTLIVQCFHCEAMKGLIFLRHSWLQIVAVFYQFRVPTAELCCYQSIDRFQRL